MKNDLTVIKGGYKHISIQAAAELTGYTETTIRRWIEAGAIAYITIKEGRRRRVLPCQEDAVQIGSMGLGEIHDLGISLQADRVRALQRASTEALQRATLEAGAELDCRRPWEATEVELLDSDLPLVEIAKRLGRTYAAVLDARVHHELTTGDKGHRGAVPA